MCLDSQLEWVKLLMISLVSSHLLKYIETGLLDLIYLYISRNFKNIKVEGNISTCKSNFFLTIYNS